MSRLPATSLAVRVRPRIGLAIVTCAVACAAGIAPSHAAAAAGDRLLIDFGQGDPLGANTGVTDVSGQQNHGVVRAAKSGAIVALPEGAADFPNACRREPCPNAMIEIADHATLDPGTAAFEWGADIRLLSSETADGENVLQKGRWGDPGGQWKLQVDKLGGKPSCVVSGFRNGRESRVIVKSSAGVADGAWHQVTCRRTSTTVQILVDGAVRGSASMQAVALSSGATVTIGAKDVASNDNDQFQGWLDDVFMRLI